MKGKQVLRLEVVAFFFWVPRIREIWGIVKLELGRGFGRRSGGWSFERRASRVSGLGYLMRVSTCWRVELGKLLHWRVVALSTFHRRL